MRYQQIPSYCRPCLERLARQAMSLACRPEEENLKKALNWLEELYSPDIPPPVIASHLHRRVKKYCASKDPYAPLKEKEIEIAQKMAKVLLPAYQGSLRKLLYFALLGNAIDFFRPTEEIEKALREGLKLALDESEKVAHKLQKASSFLLLTDNAGEVFFDLPLLSYLKERGLEVFYGVKPKPIQNDLSLPDLERLNLSLPAKVISTGAEMVGLSLSEASKEFKEIYFGVDLVMAKGMGHFETLSAEPGREIIFALCAKCVPVARALRVELNDYVLFAKR